MGAFEIKLFHYIYVVCASLQKWRIVYLLKKIFDTNEKVREVIATFFVQLFLVCGQRAKSQLNRSVFIFRGVIRMKKKY